MTKSSMLYDKRNTIHRKCLVICLLSAAICSNVGAQDDRFAGSAYLPGLTAKYTGRDGKTFERLDYQLAFHWGNETPDPRIPPGPFQARWKGRIFTKTPGEYTFHFYVTGKVEMSVAGQKTLDAKSKKTGWIKSKPVKLTFGRHPIEVNYHATTASPHIALFWSGPDFELEPVAQRWLWHDRDAQSFDDFQQGRRLVRALRCVACHQIPGTRDAIPAPALDALTGNIDHQWLTDWLTASPKKDPQNDSDAIERRMPHFGLKESEANAVSAYLLSNESRKTQSEHQQNGNKKNGEKLFFTVGCIACHTVNGVGQSGLFDGGDLSKIAEKRPPHFFQTWLTDPGKINRDHRMPVFELSQKERADLAAYLASLHGDAKAKQKPNAEPKLIRQGKQLVTAYRCYACHKIPGMKPNQMPQINIVLDAESKWDNACTGESDEKKHRPGYRLNDGQTKLVREYIASLTSVTKNFELDGALVLEERNCLSCHARGWSLGMSEHLLTIRQAHPELATELSAVSPPSLESVGDKFREDTLKTAVLGKLPARRPWLHIRMPRFPLSKDETGALVRHFIENDRIPQKDEPSQPIPGDKKLNFAGRQLVGAGGFSCISCHKVGKVRPKGVAPNVLGPDLTLLGRTVRQQWFDRFVRNPLRTGLAMEMPALTLPVANVLDENLDHQLAAVWHVLNQRGFNPPQQAVVRVVRHAKGDSQASANVLTDVLHAGERKMIKPFLIGLSNRHNVLFDLETGQLAGWWTGDTAKQWTEGKTWFWTPGGRSVIPIEIAAPEITLLANGKRHIPKKVGQFITEFDEYEHISNGIRFSHRLQFEKQKAANNDVVTIRQSFVSQQRKDGPHGFRRTIEIAGIPSRSAVEFRLAPAETTSTNAATVRLVGTSHDSRIRMISPNHVQLTNRDGKAFLTLTAGRNGTAHCSIDYLTDAPIPESTFNATPANTAQKMQMNVLPGYKATRLSLPLSLMPTALAWRHDGTLVTTSLQGKTWLLRDTDKDGLADSVTAFSDELAAPYGIAVNEKSVDILNKYALLRHYDTNNDGRADRVVTVASGWGHTADYHDWAVGPVRDENGNYYVALPCRQDERSQAAAHLRGTAFKLVPRKATSRNPLAFRIEKICDGLRFPMGLALNRHGDLFATDNQGNYNPFNELNHLQKGKHYGFYNRYEPKTNKPLTPPAIDLPHPWTRSVNGLCFLYTPESIRKKRGALFGPYEGHLLGCEYNNRSLIRMTLQKVGDTYQGACYPFTVAPKSSREKFLGPICCAVSPDGDIYVGNMHDSGWAGGQNTGSIVRLKPDGKVPTGISEMRATANGFTILFTSPIDAKRGAKRENYSLTSFRRISTPAYGGKDVDERTEKIKSVALSSDGRIATLTLDELREGFVYELRVSDLVPDGESLHPSEAYYTLRRIPAK